jgi:hypothetical protein
MSKKPKTGISRRTMLGALAAAPVAVPALANDLAAPHAFARGGYIHGKAAVGYLSLPPSEMQSVTLNIDTSRLEAFQRQLEARVDAIIRAPKLNVDSLQMEAMQNALSGNDPDAVVVIPRSNLDLGELEDGMLTAAKLQNGTLLNDTPNRLFGSYINEEGEAT